MRKFLAAGAMGMLLCAYAIASPVRIIGMGMTDLILEDESNRINLYDFGGNVAGLYTDERGSSLEGFLSYGSVSYSDTSGSLEPEITRWGGFIPTDIVLSVNTFTALGGLPAGGVFTYRSPAGYAAAAKTMFSSTSTHYESIDRTDDATAPLFGAAFAKHFGMYDIGAEGEYASITIKNNQDDTEIHASLKTIDAGFAAQVSPLFAFGLNGGLGFPGAEVTLIGTEEDFSGSAFQGGTQGVATITGLGRIGAKVDFINANLGAEMTSGGVTHDIGDLHLSDLNFETRALFASMLFPVRAGAVVGYETFHPEFEGEGTSLFDIDMQMNTVRFGVGLGYMLPMVTPGFQYRLTNQSYADKLNDTEVSAGAWMVGFGAESKLAFLMVRGGFCMGKEDPDKDTDDDETQTRTLSFGASFSMPLQPYKIEFAYVNTETKPQENPEGFKEVDNSLYCALKLQF